MALEIKVTPQYEVIEVTFDGLLHLWIDRRRLLGVRSYIVAGDKQFFIELAMQGGNLTVDYDDRVKWQEVLKGLLAVLRDEKSNHTKT